MLYSNALLTDARRAALEKLAGVFTRADSPERALEYLPKEKRTFLQQVQQAHHSLRIWHAGSSSGEEIYSLVILLYENRLLQRARIYATDINQRAREHKPIFEECHSHSEHHTRSQFMHCISRHGANEFALTESNVLPEIANGDNT